MTTKAYAKVNLRLKVLGKRSDGYHNLEMINISTDLADELSIKTRKDGKINITSNMENLPLDAENLVYRAASVMKEKYHVGDGYDIHIYKRIPVGAGLGGGSSDCAAFLRWFADEYSLNLEPDQLIGQALDFGSDVPYCLFNKPAVATGRGELLEFVSLDLPKYVVIVTPDLFVSTKEIFRQYDLTEGQAPPDKVGSGFKKTDIYEWMENDLEPVTLRLHPFLSEIKEYMEGFGFRKVLMSGSGPTFVALTDDHQQGQTFVGVYAKKYPAHFACINRIL